ncbi:hypothetical protein EVAR_98682_1 [Eumeta japonica]|uniref:RNA-directed DNA polymerase from mobile element jockey n=1 Tax=Eumeta variegata TaxID=151549 RepID=A0A4C1XZD3_EUMVA|nr:hypothetical protein EVAR_98682_1 [Eumeta japonica]
MVTSGRLNVNSVGRHKPKNISLISYNANGLIGSTIELGKCALEYKADIIMVLETHLKPHFQNSCKISNFILLRTDRQDAPKGGTAIFYNRALYCCPIDIPPLTNIEATACRLSMSGHSILILVSVHLPPKKELLRSDLERDGGSLREPGSLNFNIVTPITPTYYPNNIKLKPDILDINLIKEVALKLSSIEPLQCLNSDHRPVLMRTVVEDSSRTVPAKSDRRELPRDVIELIRDKNAALRRAGKYPTCENRARARALQRKVKARMKEVRNDTWIDLMSEISPSHKAY